LFLLSSVTAGFTLWLVLRPDPPQPHLAAFERLESGMTRAEVEAAFRLPAGDYRRQPKDPFPDDDELGLFVHRRDFVDEVREWRTDGVVVQVGFDADGRVVALEKAEVPQLIPWHRRWLDKLRAWLP
jgi:hypothetical protein